MLKNYRKRHRDKKKNDTNHNSRTSLYSEDIHIKGRTQTTSVNSFLVHLALLNNVSVEYQTCKVILSFFVSGLCSGVFKVTPSKKSFMSTL